MTPTIPPVADDEAMRIAGTLTKAQRDALCGRLVEGSVDALVTGWSLEAAGLMRPIYNRKARNFGYEPTARGHRVRAALQSEASDA